MLSNRVSSSCSTFYRKLSLNNFDFITCETPRWVCLCPTAKWHRGNGSRCSYVMLWKQQITRYSNRVVLMRQTIESMGVKSFSSSSSQKRQIIIRKKNATVVTSSHGRNLFRLHAGTRRKFTAWFTGRRCIPMLIQHVTRSTLIVGYKHGFPLSSFFLADPICSKFTYLRRKKISRRCKCEAQTDPFDSPEM